MAISPGTRFGPYEILTPLGAGGMGEVYRARDTKLNREVAIKVLLPSVAADADRLARFAREAQVLASLNHPNIAQVHGLEELPPEGGNHTVALVMELVEGPTLADRIARGPLPLDEALPIARQIAEALEAAHEQGIVHRDLKPANIKVRDDGTVKVLDFGLAKAMDPVGASGASAMNSPTLSLHATQAGLILGTAAYMSPEQASGKPVDRRTDLWALGVVILEMLTGRQVFDGETVSHVLAAVLTKEPDLATLPAGTPAPIRRLLRRCLEKDRKRRIASASDARLEIEDALGSPASDVPKTVDTRRSLLPWILAAAAAIAAAGFAALYWRQTATPAPDTVRFEIAEPEGTTFVGIPRLSPDGRMIVFAATGSADGRARLWLRRLDSLESRPVPGTEGTAGTPFWTPDGRYLIFASDNKLRKIDMEGGPAQSICDLRSIPGGGFLISDGSIVFGTAATGGIQQCAASGGAATSISALKPGGQEAYHAFPTLLPDNKHFLFWRSAGPDSGIYLGSLDAKAEDQTGRRVLRDSGAPLYVPARGGRLGTILFVREATLMAQPFDQDKLAVTGEAVPVATHLRNVYDITASATGTLAYMTGGGSQEQLAWFDRTGTRVGTVGPPGLPFPTVNFAPDGSRFASARTEPGSRADIWVVDAAQGSELRLTTDPLSDGTPIWSPDGERIVFHSDREGTQNLYVRSANGAGTDTLLFKSTERKRAADWSSNGFLMFNALTTDGWTVWVLPMNAGTAAERTPRVYLRAEVGALDPRFSPDGRFVAYQSSTSGVPEIYVRPFDPAAPDASQSAAVKVSRGGGTSPRWRADGKELFYLSPERTQMAVETLTVPSFRAGTPHGLFRIPEGGTSAAGTPDGQRFLVRMPVGGTKPTLAVIVNWRAGQAR